MIITPSEPSVRPSSPASRALDVRLAAALNDLFADFVAEPQVPASVEALQAAIGGCLRASASEGLSPSAGAAVLRKCLTRYRRDLSPWVRDRLGVAYGLRPASQQRAGEGVPADLAAESRAARQALDLDRPQNVRVRRGGIVALLRARLG